MQIFYFILFRLNLMLLEQKLHTLPLILVKSSSFPLKVTYFSDILFSSIQSPLSSSTGSTVDRTFSSDPSTGTDDTANTLSVLEFRPEPRESHVMVRDIPMLVRDPFTSNMFMNYSIKAQINTATVSNYAAMNRQSLSTIWEE